MSSHGLTDEELTDLVTEFETLQKAGIIDTFDLESGEIKISNTNALIKRMEKHVFNAFKIAFPESIIRKSAVDLYLAEVMNSHLKAGLDKETGLLTMMLSLERESVNKFNILSKFLEKEFSRFNFEKIKLQ